MELSSLGKRVATAVVLVPLVLAALFLLPPRGFGVVALVVTTAAAIEWSRLTGGGMAERAATSGAALVLGAVLLMRAAPHAGEGWPLPVVATACGAATLFWLLAAPAWLARGWPTQSPARMALVGLVVLVAFFVALVELQSRSPWLVLAAMAVVWIADTAAYFAGRAFGHRKLAPSISPGKTWEGVYGGLACVSVYAAALLALAEPPGGSVSPAAVVAFVLFVVALAAISVVGDLFESLLKRHAGVKDSGTLLPGHGGLLDRIDALLAAMPAAALAAAACLRAGTTA